MSIADVLRQVLDVMGVIAFIVIFLAMAAAIRRMTERFRKWLQAKLSR
jgi:hypothetical protein